MSDLFAVLFLLSLVLMVVSAIRPFKNKKTGKAFRRKDLLIGFGITTLVLAILTGITGPTPKTQNVADLKSKAATSSSSKTASKPKTVKVSTTTVYSTNKAATAPTVSLATLNAQAIAAFTPVMNSYEQLLAQGESYAKQPNAADVNSAFHTWYNQVEHTQNVADGNEANNVYVNADNAYYNAHQTAPDAISNWGQDAGDAFDDIVTWGYDEWTVVVEQGVGGGVNPSDQQTVNTDLQHYQSDLAKAQADISQL